MPCVAATAAVRRPGGARKALLRQWRRDLSIVLGGCCVHGAPLRAGLPGWRQGRQKGGGGSPARLGRGARAHDVALLSPSPLPLHLAPASRPRSACSPLRVAATMLPQVTISLACYCPWNRGAHGNTQDAEKYVCGNLPGDRKSIINICSFVDAFCGREAAADPSKT